MKKLFIKIIVFLLAYSPALAAPVFVPTYHNVGITWDETGKGSANEVTVEYRVDGAGSWSTAQSLWYDDRTGGSYNPTAEHYKGSIVGLNDGTTYNVRLTMLSDPFTTTTNDFTTWSNNHPEGSVTGVSDQNTMLTISSSGTDEAYLVYEPSGESATIDGNGIIDYCITVDTDVHHVIIRNINCQETDNGGVLLKTGTHDIVMDGLDISAWGDNSDDYEGGIETDYNAGGTNTSKYTIQRCYIHDPNNSSTSWTGGSHPYGPQGIVFWFTDGNHVIRYNKIIGDSDDTMEDNLYFNDALGAGPNQSASYGFPGNDSDIYGNYISHAWDECIEAEGSNKNVRIYGNYMNKCFNHIGFGAVDVGPIYLFRNIADTSRTSGDVSDSDDFTCTPEWATDCYHRGELIKSGNRDLGVGESGRQYVYHNTMLGRDAPGKTYDLGGGAGFSASAGGEIYELITRNNILMDVRDGNVLKWSTTSCTNDSDYDLYYGDIHATKCASPAPEANGINSRATFETGHGDDYNDGGFYWLDAATSGHDDGVVLPNFNDDYEGAGPDMGAHERGSGQMIFGIEAYNAYELSASGGGVSGVSIN